MRKTLSAVLAVATIAGAIAVSASDASAQRRYYRGGGNGGAAAAGIIGGLAVGAIVGGAIANSRPAYGGYAPVQGYDPYPVYSARGPIGCPGGYWARRPVAFNRFGEAVAWSKPRFFCP